LYLPLEKEEAGVSLYSGEGYLYPDMTRQEVSTYCPVEPCNGIDQVNNIYSTDVIGGNQFISSTLEYRFPISETLGLQGLVFFDTGNAFAEDELLFDVTDWRYGTGVGVQWFSPFGPLAVIMGFPLDKLAVEDSPVFEFSMGGADF
jgi:outer membrane protein assembly factor BamA